MSSARWDTELLFPHAVALLEIVCYPPCEAELSCSLISSSFPKLFIFSNRPQEPSAPSPKLFCSKQSCCRGSTGSAEREDLHRSPSPRGVLWAQISPTRTQSLPRPGLCGKGEVFLRGTERFLPEAFARESPTAPRGSRAGCLQVVNVFYFFQAVSLMKTWQRQGPAAEQAHCAARRLLL